MTTFTEHDIAARLALDNPWWRGKGSPLLRQGMGRRLYFNTFRRLAVESSVRRAVVLMGPRRVGKTVMIHQVVESLLAEGVEPSQILYLSLDMPLYTGAWPERLLLLASHRHGLDLDREAFVFFDEVQYLPDWERHLKSLVDTFPSVRFTVSGSAAAALKLKSRESGAGRFTDFLLPPLCFAEYLDFTGHAARLFAQAESSALPRFTGSIEELNELFADYINFGGYPEALFHPEIHQDRERFICEDIIDKVLLKDIPSLYGISDTQELNRLFAHLAAKTGQEVSLEGLASDSGLSVNTIKKYIEYLEAAFLIGISRRVDQNARRFKKEHGFKVYLTNCTMHAALFGPAEPDSAAFGHLVETALANQTLHAPHKTLFYSRWKNREVDIVLFDSGDYTPSVALEVKWSDRQATRPKELGGLLDFCRANALGVANVSTKTHHEVQVIDEILVIFRPSAIDCYHLGLFASAMRRDALTALFETPPHPRDHQPGN